MFAISKTTKILAAIFGTCATATLVSGIHDRKVASLGEITDEDIAEAEKEMAKAAAKDDTKKK